MVNFVIGLPSGQVVEVEIGDLGENLDMILPKNKCFIIKNSSDELFMIIGDGSTKLGNLPFVTEDEMLGVIKKALLDYVPRLTRVPSGWEK